MIAAKFGDPVLGIDIHMVMVPAPNGAVPAPLPHPFIGVVFDPIGAAMGAAIGAVFGGGGAVIVNGMPTGNTGTEVKNVPHTPTPPGFAPAPCDPPGNEGTLVTGSKTVEFGGSSESRTLSSVMSCNFPVNLPTSICGAIPAGAPVLIGGPEAVDFAAAATQGIRTKWVSDKLNALLKATKGGKLSKAICFLTGHPVDVMTGELIADAVDASLPGTIPLTFERNYRSRETESQSLGPGWYHFFDSYVEPLEGATRLRLPDGRPANHPSLKVGESYFHPPDRTTLTRDRDGYRLKVPEGRTYVFKPTLPVKPTEPDARHRLVEIRDRSQNVVSLTWKARYLADIVDTAGRRIACRYTRQGALERLVIIEGGAERLLVSYAYGPDGQLSKVTDPLGHSMAYAYGNGVMVREVHKSGLTFHFEWDWDHPEGWCIRTWGDAGEGDPASMDLAPGARAPRAIYDRRITYDKHRHRTMVHDGRGGITSYEGSALDLVEKEIDPTGRTKKYEWNEHAWKTAEENGLGERTEWTYDERGNRLSEKNALGHTTTWSYDREDRVTAVVTPVGGTYGVDYDRTSKPSVIRAPDGSATLYSYDDRGRLLRVEDAMGHRTLLQWTDTHDLAQETDPEGRVSTYRYDPLGRLIASTDPAGRELLIERDAAGRPTRIQRQDGEVLTRRYDAEGNVTEETDSRSRTTKMRYAGLGKLVEHADAMGHRTRLRYNEELELVGVENPKGELYSFTLDLASRITEERTFSGTKRKFIHDKAGRLSRIVSAAYRVTKLERDPLGRVVRQTSEGGNPLVLAKPTEETFAYDALGDLIAATTPAAHLELQRDALGRVIHETGALPSLGTEASLSHRYDPSGLRVERTTSYAHKTTYRYNRSAELTGVSTDWDLGNMPAPIKRGLAQSTLGAFDVTIARDRLGQELARRLPGGVVSVWERDTFARPTEQRILTGATTQSPGRSVSTHKYQWSAPEEIASITTLGGDSKLRTRSAFEYDPRGHLVRQLRATPCAPENGVANGETLVRQTDSVGNLYRSADFGDREYGKGGVIRRAGGTLYETDADGFLVKKTLADGAVWHYAWDAHGQLTEVTRPDKKKVAFAYDAFGRRVSKTFDGATTAFIWDGDDLVHERVQGQDGAFLPLTTWVFEPGSFTPLAKIEGRKRYGIVGDHLGAPTMLATEAGELAWQAQLDIYGVPREDASGIKAEHRTDNPWRYPGQYEDKETGLYYNRFRYYDPELGRYISEDPIGLEGGLPQYGYVHDPLGWVDPFGLSGVLVIGEGQDAVDETARKLRDAGYDARSMGAPSSQWRGGAAPFNTKDKLDRALAFNRRWINEQMDAGVKIVDIGPDGRHSAFYKAELEEIAARGYATMRLKKLPGGETVGELRARVGCG